MNILARIDALLANTPPSEVEEFEVCRCLRDAKAEIERLRLTDAEREAVEVIVSGCSEAQEYSVASNAVKIVRGLLERTK